jgi:histone H3/H4
MEQNRLIKRKGLVKIFRKNKIRGISEEAIGKIEWFLEEETEQLVQTVKQRLLIKGRKIVKGRDILEGVKQIRKVREEYYEI